MDPETAPATTEVVVPAQPLVKKKGRPKGSRTQQLSLQQEKFLAAYARHGDIRKAMNAAGYSPRSQPGSVLASSAVRLRLTQIKSRLQAQASSVLPKDIVLRELAAVSFSNVGDLFDENGDPVPIQDLSSDAKAAVQQYQKTSTGTTVKFYDKLTALELAMRHLGLLEKETGSGLIVQVTVGTLAPAQLDPILTAKVVDVSGNTAAALPQDTDS